MSGLQEIDYIGEGRNADRFRRNFSEVDWVQAPVVSWPHTSPRVITLQYLPGVKVSHTAPSSDLGSWIILIVCLGQSCSDIVPD